MIGEGGPRAAVRPSAEDDWRHRSRAQRDRAPHPHRRRLDRLQITSSTSTADPGRHSSRPGHPPLVFALLHRAKNQFLVVREKLNYTKSHEDLFVEC
jgi:hypothetical protein